MTQLAPISLRLRNECLTTLASLNGVPQPTAADLAGLPAEIGLRDAWAWWLKQQQTLPGAPGPWPISRQKEARLRWVVAFGLVATAGIGVYFWWQARAAMALDRATLLANVVAARPPFNKQRVTFTSDGLTLVGFVFKPAGTGPFPSVIWNHGSEPNPAGGPQFDSVASIFVPAGYAVFAPVRRGHAGSEGRWIQDTIRSVLRASGGAAAERLMVHLHETQQLDDQLAFLAYAKRQSFVDTTRMVVAGCSYGGIQTLLAAERGAGLKAAMPISPAALSWQGHRVLQGRLIRAVRTIDIPVFLIQPPKDASLEPARVLGGEARRAGKARFAVKVYPATMPDSDQVHCFGGAKGFRNRAQDALAFFAVARSGSP